MNETLIWIANSESNTSNLAIPKQRDKTTYTNSINLPTTNEAFNKVDRKCGEWQKYNICDVRIWGRVDHNHLFTLSCWNEQKQTKRHLDGIDFIN